MAADAAVCKCVGAETGVCFQYSVLSPHEIRFYASIDLLDLVYKQTIDDIILYPLFI